MNKLIFIIPIVFSTLIIGILDLGEGSGLSENIVDNIIISYSDTLAKTCVDCHADLLAEETVHQPAKKDCERCHILSGEEHPIKNKHTFNLADKVPDLCYECHESKSDMDLVHTPVKEGKCLDCHFIHSSPNLYLVKVEPVSGLCLTCHKLDVSSAKMVHQPFADGSCTKCHNPHQSESKSFLQMDQPRLCTQCHRDHRAIAKLENVHPPYKNDCLSCHRPHSSTEEHLSDLKLQDLCFSCHSEFKAAITSLPVVHQAIYEEKTCLNCHTPHASNEAHILSAKENDVCISCHDKTLMAAGGSMIRNIKELLSDGNTIHGAIKDNGCTVCHQPHGSERHFLLAGQFPETEYIQGIAENFELCFRCHNKKLFDEPQTITNTNFRNGEKNLHYTHIYGTKGRNCTLCHNVHGSAGKHLIEEKTTFGNWEMPIRFKSLEHGGSCAPGCHEERKYERLPLADSIQQKITTVEEAPESLKPSN